MTDTNSEEYGLAYDFVLEYLDRDLDFIDVVEFVDEAGAEVDPEEVYELASAMLSDHAQRFEGLDD